MQHHANVVEMYVYRKSFSEKVSIRFNPIWDLLINMQQNRKQNVRTIMNPKSLIFNLKRIRRDGVRCVSELDGQVLDSKGLVVDWVDSLS